MVKSILLHRLMGGDYMIAHASQDENGKTTGTTPGDQNKKEVCIRTYYNKPWNYLLRCTDTQMREKIACAMEKAANNDQIGYSQPHRNNLLKACRAYQYDPSMAKIPCDCDCSSLVSVACMYAGIPESVVYTSNNCCTTSNIRTKLMATGKFQTLTDSKYFANDDYLYRGDILLKEPGHVAVNITDGKSVKKNDSTQTTPTSTSTNKAIDISQYNPIRDYTAMGNQFEYVLIRVGYRGSESGSIVEDKLFKTHIDACLKNNMSVGVYFYDQSINEAEAEEQAVWVANTIKKYKVTLPVFIDSEYSKNHTGRADNISKTQRTNNIIAFCNKIKSLGYVPGVYASNSWLKSMVNFDQIKNYYIWCARYSTSKPDISKYDMWQYGSEMYSWATGVIDTNYIYTNLKINYTQSGTNNTVIPQNNTLSGITQEKTILLMGQVNITEGTLNVRKLPTTDSPIVMQLKKDQYVQLRGDLGTWYRMDLGYVSKKYIKEVHGVTIADNLNLRTTPDSASKNNIIKTLPINTEVIICTANNGWYNILLGDGTTGWVKGTYLRLK